MASLLIPAGVPLEDALVRDTGDRWYAAMERQDGRLIVADSATDLVAELIDDYPLTGTPEQRLNARIDFAAEQATIAQTATVFALELEGEFDAATADENILTALFTDRETPVTIDGIWDHPAQLVLIDTTYAPYADMPRPEGNVRWIDASDELRLLLSLGRAGDLRVWIDTE